MSDAQEKFKILKVTVEQQYYIPMHDDVHTQINGWEMKDVIDDWFRKHGMFSHHATRDAYHIGGGDKFIKVEVEDNEQDKQQSNEDG